MQQMTYNEYDEMIEKFETLKTPVCWPTQEQLLMFERNPDKWLKFCCYLYEFSPKAKTEEEIASKRGMMAYINRHLELVDNEDEYFDNEEDINEEEVNIE